MVNFGAVFAKPGTELKPWAIWIWNRTVTEAEVGQQLSAIAEKGFGGVAIRPGRDMNPPYMSRDFLKIFGLALQICKEKGLRVRIADDFSMPWCDVFEDACNQNPELRLSRLILEHSEVVQPKGAFEREISDPATALVLASRLRSSAVDLDTTKILSLQPGKTLLSWKPPSADEWRVMVLRKQYVKYPSGLHVPNIFSTKIADLYIKTYLEPLRKKFPKFTPSPFEGFVTEMPGLFPSDKGIPWDDLMVIRYRSKYKKDIVKLLPCLFFDASSGHMRNRPHVLSFLVQAMYDDFADPLERWGARSKFTQWLLCPEQDLFARRSALNYFHAMPAGHYKHVGWQNIEGTSANLPLQHTCASLNAVEFKRQTLTVVGRNRACAAGSIQSLKTEVEQNLAMGDSTIIFDGLYFNLDHRTHIKTPFNPFWYSPEWDFMQHLCQYATRLRAASQRLRARADIAVVFPSVSAQGEYTPDNSEVVPRAMSEFSKVVDEMRRLNIGFDVLSEEALAACAVRPNGEFGTSDKVRTGNYRVLILPYSRFVSKSLFVFLEKLEAKAGTVIFIDDAPQGSLDEGIAGAFTKRVEKLLQSRHGKAVVLAPTELSRLREWVEPPAPVAAQGKECPDVTATLWTANDYSMAYAANSSDANEWHVTIDLPQTRHIYAIDCATGSAQELSSVERVEKANRCSLTFQPWQSRLLCATNTKLVLAGMREKEKKPAIARPKGARNYRVVLRNQWKLSLRSLNVLPLSSWSTRIGLSREFGGYSHYCETYFEVKEIPAQCCLLLNEFSGVVGSDPGLDRSFDLTVNGSRVEHFYKGTLPAGPDGTESPLKIALSQLGYARNSLVCDLRNMVAKGYNRIALRSVGLIGDPPVILYPPLVVGDFSVERGTKGWVLSNISPMVPSESWTKYGFPYLSGAAVYTQVFEVPTAYERLVLNFSKVSGPLGVAINGIDQGWMHWQPMELEVTKACTAKRNELTVTILNTVDNVLRLNGRPSGLLGDVFLDVY